MREVTHREVLALIHGGAADLVETLPLHEYRKTHIRGANHLPLSRLLRDAPEALSLERPIVVYCRDSL